MENSNLRLFSVLGREVPLDKELVDQYRYYKGVDNWPNINNRPKGAIIMLSLLDSSTLDCLIIFGGFNLK